MKTYNRKENFPSLIAYFHLVQRQQMSQLPIRELISLLEAHLEIVLPLSGNLLVHRALVINILSWLRHAALIL